MKTQFHYEKYDTFTGKGQHVPQREITGVTITLSLNELTDLLSDAFFGTIPNEQELRKEGCEDLIPVYRKRMAQYKEWEQQIIATRDRIEKQNRDLYVKARKQENSA